MYGLTTSVPNRPVAATFNNNNNNIFYQKKLSKTLTNSSNKLDKLVNSK